MTTMFPIEVRCASCGHHSRQFVTGSIHPTGNPDPDLPPLGMERSTMARWLQQCEACHYTAPDLTAAPPVQARDIMASAAYQHLLSDTQYPGLARRFLTYALLMDHCDDEAAGLARLHAAWVCDDSGLRAQAARCRFESVQTLLRTKPLEAIATLTDNFVSISLMRSLQRQGGKASQ